MAEVGDILLGKYQVERELGRGGMGVVLAVKHLVLGEVFAMKLVLPEYALNAEVVGRFIREARSSVRIQSEHVCKVSDVGQLPTGEPYMLMEMLRGSDLEHVLADRRQPLPADEAVEYIMQALEAIAEAHAAGIVHRDLKPANLFLTRRRNGTSCVKVLDFGISKMLEGNDSHMDMMTTHTAAILGSPLYMSPEQIESAKQSDARTDIWALGVILYQLVTNQLPVNASSLQQLVLRMVTQTPIAPIVHRPELPAGLSQAIMRCLEKSRDARFANVAELAAALAPFGPPAAKLSLHAIMSFSPALGAREATDEEDASTEVHALAPLPGTLGPLSAKATVPAVTAIPRKTGWIIGAGVTVVAAGIVIGILAGTNPPTTTTATGRDTKSDEKAAKKSLPATEPTPMLSASSTVATVASVAPTTTAAMSTTPPVAVTASSAKATKPTVVASTSTPSIAVKPTAAPTATLTKSPDPPPIGFE